MHVHTSISTTMHIFRNVHHIALVHTCHWSIYPVINSEMKHNIKHTSLRRVNKHAIIHF